MSPNGSAQTHSSRVGGGGVWAVAGSAEAKSRPLVRAPHAPLFPSNVIAVDALIVVASNPATPLTVLLALLCAAVVRGIRGTDFRRAVALARASESDFWCAFSSVIRCHSRASATATTKPPRPLGPRAKEHLQADARHRAVAIGARAATARHRHRHRPRHRRCCRGRRPGSLRAGAGGVRNRRRSEAPGGR